MQARAVPVRRRSRTPGYDVVLHGLNQWNGVAIASRLPIEDVEIGFPDMPGFLKGHDGPDLPKEARAIGATVDGVRALEPVRAQRPLARRPALPLQARLAGDALPPTPGAGSPRSPTCRSR